MFVGQYGVSALDKDIWVHAESRQVTAMFEKEHYTVVVAWCAVEPRNGRGSYKLGARRKNIVAG